MNLPAMDDGRLRIPGALATSKCVLEVVNGVSWALADRALYPSVVSSLLGASATASAGVGAGVHSCSWSGR